MTDATNIFLPITINVDDKRKKKKVAGPSGPGTTSGESNLISRVGVYSPRLHSKGKKRKKYILPETGKAPFSESEKAEEDRALIPGFGGITNYVRPTGVQQERVTHRGATRFEGGGQAFPQIKSFRQRVRDLERQALAERRGVQDIDSKVKAGINRFSRSSDILTNPQAVINQTMFESLTKIGKFGGIIGTAIGAALTAPDNMRKIIMTLAVKGGFLNHDWHREIAGEDAGLFTLEEQKRRKFGTDAFINAQGHGYTPISGTNNYNSLYIRDEDRIARIGQDAKAKGLA